MCCVSLTSFAKSPSKFASRFFIGPLVYLWWRQINPGDLGNIQSFQAVVGVICEVGDDKSDLALYLMGWSEELEINVLLVFAKITFHESVVIYHQCINQLIFIVNSLVVLKKKVYLPVVLHRLFETPIMKENPQGSLYSVSSFVFSAMPCGLHKLDDPFS